jgi:hypothetical protein
MSDYKIVESLRFESLGSCLEYAERADPANKLKCFTFQNTQMNWGFAGGSFAYALKLARTGWSEGLNRIKRCEDLIVAKLNAGNDLVRSMDVSGDESDISLFIEGDPEYMVTYQMGEGRKPVVRLVVSVSASCAISNDTITMRGAAICAAIDAVESSGVRVELVIDSSWVIMTEPRKVAKYQIVTKRSEDSLDRDKIAFVLMHPTMLRQIVFRLTESNPTTNPSFVDRSYGIPIDPIQDDPDAVYMGCMHYDDGRWNTTESAVAATKRLIEQLSAKAA